MQNFINIGSQILAFSEWKYPLSIIFSRPIICLIFFPWQIFTFSYAFILPPLISSLQWFLSLSLPPCLSLFWMQLHIKQVSRLLRIPDTQKGTSRKKTKQKKPPEIMKMFNMAWPWALFSVFSSAAFHAISARYCVPCESLPKYSTCNFVLDYLFFVHYILRKLNFFSTNLIYRGQKWLTNILNLIPITEYVQWGFMAENCCPLKLHPTALKVQAKQGCASVKAKWQNVKKTWKGWQGWAKE